MEERKQHSNRDRGETTLEDHRDEEALRGKDDDEKGALESCACQCRHTFVFLIFILRATGQYVPLHNADEQGLPLVSSSKQTYHGVHNVSAAAYQPSCQEMLGPSFVQSSE